jgi:hypothetical protein
MVYCLTDLEAQSRSETHADLLLSSFLDLGAGPECLGGLGLYRGAVRMKAPGEPWEAEPVPTRGFGQPLGIRAVAVLGMAVYRSASNEYKVSPL